VRRVGSLLEASNVEKRGRLFFEEPFLVLGGEMPQEPVGSFRGTPAEETQRRALLHVLGYAVLCQRRLAADV
jgi:hypothetical protein